MELKETMHFKRTWTITRYPNDEAFHKGEPAPVVDADGILRPAVSIIEGNLLLNEGITALLNVVTGAGNNAPWNSGNARIGVGDNNLAANNTQTALQGNNKAWATMANGYPSVANQTATWEASFDGNTANHGWNEFTVVNAANDSGQNLNRVVSAQGTKTTGQTWTVSLQLTLS